MKTVATKDQPFIEPIVPLVVDRTTIYSTHGCVNLDTPICKPTNGEPIDVCRAEYEIEHHNGVVGFQITVDGDAPRVTYIRVEATSQDVATTHWYRLATMVIHAEWWD